MKTTTKIILFTIVLTSILLSLGYAAIQNVTLNITGNVTADPNQSNFKVRFVRDVEPTVSDPVYATAGVTDDLNAVLNVNGLNAKGQTIEAIYEVENISTDLSSDLTISVTNSNTEYFKVTSQLAATSLKAGEKTTVTIIVELIKTPLQSVSSTIGVQTIAAPVQPGEEGTTDFPSTEPDVPEIEDNTFNVITAANYGDAIDLGIDVLNSTSTSDDWRILYKDDNYVYAILGDYMPTSKFPSNAAYLAVMPTQYPFGVGMATTVDRMMYEFSLDSVWNNWFYENGGVSGIAKVEGTVSPELLLNSYNEKNGTNLVYTNYPQLDSSTDRYNLYVPHSTQYQSCLGYYLAKQQGTGLWYIRINGYLGAEDVSGYNYGIRPIVYIPVNTTCVQENYIWKIVE